MTNGFMHRVHDGLAIRTDLVDVVVEIANPTERRLRRRDVISFGAEHHDRGSDVAQCDLPPVGGLDLSRGQLVADEQLIDDELDFFRVEIDVAAPPTYKAKIARRFRVDL